MPIYIVRTSVVTADSFVNYEVPTPATDGARIVFTVASPYEAGSLVVHRDQLNMFKGGGNDFTETSDTTFTMASAPDADEELWVSYIKK